MEPVFVSRDKELGWMYELLKLAFAGKGQVCFVTGEAGAGKTSLTAEFARRSQRQHDDLLVAIGDCNSQTGISDPYLPFREVLGMLAGDIDDRVAQGMTTLENASRLRDFLRVTKRIISEVGPDLIDIFVPGVGLATKAGVMMAGDDQLRRRRASTDSSIGADTGSQTRWVHDADQSRIFEQVTRVLVTMASKRPLILILDDLHWVDDSSASLLFHLARRIEGSRILIVGTYRPEETALSRGDFNHPLAQIVPELKRLYGDLMISLGDEDEVEGRRFVEALIDTENNRLGSDFRDLLFARTRGHPLFTTELLRDMQESGALLRDLRGNWVAGPHLDWEQLPARAEGVVEERINRLNDDLRQILTIASVEGEVFTAQIVARIAGLDERKILTMLTQELDRRHRLVSEEGAARVGKKRISQFRFRHQIFQQYFYDNLGINERELLHEDVASHLEAIYSERTDDVAVQLAHHFENAGLHEHAGRYLLQAGRRAYRMYAYSEAAALAGQGLAATSNTEADPRMRIDLLLLLGDAQHHAGRVTDSMDTFRSAGELAIKAGDSDAAARAAIGYSEPRWRYNMIDATSVELLSDALGLLDKQDSALRACLIAHLARASEGRKPGDEVVAMLDESLAMARRLNHPPTLIDCARFRFSLDRDPRRIHERLNLANEMLGLSEQVEDKNLVMELTVFLIYDSLAVGDLETCNRYLDAMERIAAEIGDPFYTYNVAAMRVVQPLLAGRFDDAERLAMSAFETGQRLGVDNVEGVLGVQMFTIRREQGRLQEIAPMVKHFVDERGAGAAWRPGLALIYTDIGETAEARAQFERLAVNDFASIARDSLWETCLCYLAEICSALDDKARARMLYDLLLPYDELNVVVSNATACLGAASRFLGQLATTLGLWDAAETHYRHAIDENVRLGALPWLAHSRFHYAAMLLQRNAQGDAVRARQQLEQAGSEATALGMTSLMTRVKTLNSDG